MATLLTELIADFSTALAAKMAIGATTATLQSATDSDGVALPAGQYNFTLDGDNAQKEYIVATLAGTALTAIKTITRQGTQTAGCVREHRVGAKVEITDFAAILYMKNLLNGTTDLDATDPLKYDGVATINNNAHLATKKYVDDTASAGASDSDETTKGILELATSAEARYGDDTGSTTAPLATRPSHLAILSHEHKTNSYKYGENVTAGDVLYLKTADSKWWKADGSAAATADDTYGIAFETGVTDNFKYVLLPGSQCETVTGLTTAGLVYLSDTAGTASNVAGTYKKVIGFSPDGTSMFFYPQLRIDDLAGSTLTTALANEVATFFGATDITGAQAETLTDGSDAGVLHNHLTQINKYEGAGEATQLKTYWAFTLSGVDGWTNERDFVINVAGGASIGVHATTDNTQSLITPIMAYLTTGASDRNIRFDDNKDVIVEFGWCDDNDQAGVEQSGFGLASTGVAFQDYDDQTVDAACFTRDAAKNLYAHTSNAGVGHTETLIAGISLGVLQTYRIEFNPGVDVKFYINGVLKATHTTNLPDGTNTINFGIGASGNSDASSTMIIVAPHCLIEK